MSGVQLREIHHSFGKSPVLNGLSLDVEAGDYVVLLGQSGCGKTTTLRMVAGLLRPTKGSISIDGKCVDSVPPRRRNVSMVFQNDSLYPHLTVRQSIAFPLRGSLDSGEIEARIDEAAELAGAREILHRYPDRLSGGELRRGAIAKAVARRASVRLMDEPLSALDATVRTGIQDDLLRWHHAVPGTTIHVTHDGQEAIRLADKIAVMENGGIVQYGSPAEIYDRPLTRSVAKAVGSPPINWLPKGFETDGLSTSFTLPSESSPEIGIRPESLEIAEGQGQGQAHPPGIFLSGHVSRLAEIDGMKHVGVRIGELDVTAVLRPACRLQPGDACQLFAEFRHLHRFDRGTGMRLPADGSVAEQSG